MYSELFSTVKFMDEESKQLLAQMLEELRQMRAMSGNTAKAAEDTTKALNNLTDDLGEAAEFTEDLNEAQEELAKAMKLSAEGFKQSLRSVGSSVMSFGSALTDTTKTLGSLSDGFDNLGDAALEAGKAIGGPFAIAAGLAAKALTTVTSAALKQSDAILGAKDELTKLGGAGIGTSKEFMTLAHEAKISSKNLNLLTEPMKGMAGTFLSLGGSVAEGQKNFTKLTAITDEQRKAFGRLGLSQADVIQSQADYIKLQKMSGTNLQALGKTVEQIRAASVQYTQNLVELAAISGGDIDSAKKAQEIANTQFAELLRTRNENAEIAKLKAAGRHAEAADIEARQKYRKQMISEMTAQFGEGTGEAMAQYFATGIVNEAVAPLLRQGVDLEKQRQAFIAAGNDEEKQRKARAGIATDLKDAEGRTLKNMETALGQSDDLRKQMGVSVDSMQKYGARAGVDEYDIRTKAAKDVAEQMKEGADPMADAREDLRETQRDLAVGLDKLLLAVNPLTTQYGLMTLALVSLTAAIGTTVLALKGLSGLGALGGPGGAAGKFGNLGKLGGFANTGGVAGGGGLGGAVAQGGGALSKMGGLAARVGGGVGIAAIGGLAGAGLQAAGESIGGTTGKVVSGAGTVAQFAAMGAMFGPAGALVGAIGGLGKALWDNKDSLVKGFKSLVGSNEKSDKVTIDKSEVDKELAKRKADSEERLRSVNAKLSSILGENSDVLGMFSGKMDTMTDEAFTKLVDELKSQGKITEAQIAELKQQREVATRKTEATPNAATEFKAIAQDKKFTSEDSAKLSKEKNVLAALQAELKTAKGEDKEAIQMAINNTKAEVKALEDKQKAEAEYNKAETKRVEAEKKKAEMLKKVADATERAQKKEEERVQQLVEANNAARAIHSGGPSSRGRRRGSSASGGTGQAGTAAPSSSGGSGGAGGGAGGASSGGASGGREGAGGRTGSSGSLGLESIKKTTAAGGSISEEQAKKMTMDFEGVRTKPYKDSLGLWTVGVGHLIGDGRSLPDSWNREFSMDEIMALYDEDYKHHKQQAQSNVPGFSKFDSAGQAALVDLTFNMGPYWPKKFPNTSKKLAAGDAAGAAAGLEDSLWFSQVARRGPAITDIIRNSKVSAKDGGLATGPESGYPATLHGKEMILPLKGDSILEKLGTMSASMMKGMNEKSSSDWASKSTPQGDSLLEKLGTMATNMLEKEVGSDSKSMESLMQNMIDLNQKSTSEWVSKLDKVIDVLENQRTTQEKTLRAVRT